MPKVVVAAVEATAVRRSREINYSTGPKPEGSEQRLQIVPTPRVATVLPAAPKPGRGSKTPSCGGSSGKPTKQRNAAKTMRLVKLKPS